MTRIAPVLLGFAIFISYNYFGSFLQTKMLYLDGFFIKILFTAVIGLFFIKVFKYTLSYKTSFISAFIVFFCQVIARILHHTQNGWSIPKIVVVSTVAEILTLVTVFIVLIILGVFVSKSK